MELRQIQAFLAVAEQLHFRRAAERLNLAQPALSRLIRSLEKEVGVELFERTTRSVRLSAAGEAVLEPARRIQAEVDQMARAARSARVGETGRITLGFAGLTGYAIASRLVRDLATHRPGITLELRAQNFSGEALTMVLENELDLAVASPPVPAGVTTLHVRDDDLLLAVPESHPLASASRVRPQQMRGERFVSYSASHRSRVGDALVAWCLEGGFVPDVVQEAPDSYSVLALVGAGVGTAMVVDTARGIHVPGVRYVPLAGRRRCIPIALSWRQSNPSVPLHTVLEFTRSHWDLPPASPGYGPG